MEEAENIVVYQELSQYQHSMKGLQKASLGTGRAMTAGTQCDIP
jgi:hypothetical protein